MRVRNMHAVVLGIVTGVVLAACSAGVPASDEEVTSVLSEAEAQALLVGALEAFNGADYVAWSAGWSPKLKSAINETGFHSFVENTKPQTGNFVSMGPVELVAGKDRGYVRWQTTAQFEDARIRFGVSMTPVDRTVHGVFFDPVR